MQRRAFLAALGTVGVADCLGLGDDATFRYEGDGYRTREVEKGTPTTTATPRNESR
ncbi:hypothetical protein ACFO0N_13240 [Halobium salinum]|uniref:Uncharacterized protein n=1 Tax=Halobium salinum TaxID=1364940 RepID=A0ABD5PDW8_9EURY|nr:hypothetical protein [Halobium salinum]